MGQQVCCASACVYNEERPDTESQRRGVGGKEGNELFVISAMGVRTEKLEEDYVSEEEDVAETFPDQEGY